MARPALGILVGILIFIAAGVLAVYWIAKVRQEREERKPRLAYQLVYAEGGRA
jgi:hypothetical protein